MEANSGSAPTSTGTSPTQLDTPDPLTPVITHLDDHTTSVTLRWDDPTNGQATFLIRQRANTDTETIYAQPGTTQIQLTGLNPAVPQYCFTVAALLPDDGPRPSPERCIPIRH